MTRSAQVAFYSLLGIIFLTPLFFLPSQVVSLGVAKTILLTLGAIVIIVSILIEAIGRKGVTIPRSHILWLSLLLPVIYIVSALASGHPTFSFFGYVLEPGTVGSILVFSLLFLASALILDDRSKLIRALSAFFLSLCILSVFVALKVFSHGSWLTLGIFSGSMGNSLGSWADLSVVFGLLALLSALVIEMLPVTGDTRALAWVALAISTFLLIVLDFPTSWMLVLGASVTLLIYFNTVEEEATRNRPGVWVVGLLAFLSLLFIWNPSVDGQALNERVASAAGLANSDVRPNLSSTFSVAKSALAGSPLLGSGPNTFAHEWLLYKPSGINSTGYWNVAFPFGFGFLETQFTTTGILGILGWLLFLTLLVALGVKALSKSSESKPDRFMLLSSSLIAIFLWAGSLLYTPSLAVIALTFISAGLLVGALSAVGLNEYTHIAFDRSALSHFVSVLVTLILLAGAAVFGFGTLNKVLAAMHYGRALSYSNSGASIDSVESELVKATQASPADVYWSALSQVEVSRANQLLRDSSIKAADREKQFQEAVSSSIAALQNAIKLSYSYENWASLGNLYSSLVPAPLSVTSAYDVAISAYKEAEKLNPGTPEIPYLLGKLELDKGDLQASRERIDEALKKKADYAEAYFLLAKLEVMENNLTEAIKSAETGALLSPGNAGVFFELGLLKYSAQDYTGATSALEKALVIVPEYANAKYYLALAYDKLGRREEAIKLFEDLATTNPSNAIITSALANLRIGRDALYQSSAINNSAPVSGQ